MADRIRQYLSSNSDRNKHASQSSDQAKMPSTSTPPSDQDGKTIGRSGTPSTPKNFPKGVVLGADGKPCRSCTSFAAWASMTSSSSSSPNPALLSAQKTTSKSPSSVSSTTPVPPPDCPADVDVLGRSTWTFLHTLAATYPVAPSKSHQARTAQFLNLFGDLYPCAPCAADFRDWMALEGNTARVQSRAELGRWLCEAHNAVNEKLGKERFECKDWEKRWRTGDWPDGRCG